MVVEVGELCWEKKETLKTYQLRSIAQSLSLHQKKYYINVLETKILCLRLWEHQIQAQFNALFSAVLEMNRLQL